MQGRARNREARKINVASAQHLIEKHRNVRWMIPTLTFSVATKAKGTPQHSWAMVSQTNSPPAIKAGLTASKWMVASALDCLIHPEIISDAWEEHNEYLAQNTFYHPILNDVKVPSFKDLYGIEPAHVPMDHVDCR